MFSWMVSRVWFAGGDGRPSIILFRGTFRNLPRELLLWITEPTGEGSALPEPLPPPSERTRARPGVSAPPIAPSLLRPPFGVGSGEGRQPLSRCLRARAPPAPNPTRYRPPSARGRTRANLRPQSPYPRSVRPPGWGPGRGAAPLPLPPGEGSALPEPRPLPPPERTRAH